MIVIWCSVIIYTWVIVHSWSENKCADRALPCIYSCKTRMPWGWCCDRQSRRSQRGFQTLCCTLRTLFIDNESRWKKKDTDIWAWRRRFLCSSGKTVRQHNLYVTTDPVKTLTLITHEEFIMDWSSVECERQL